MTLNNAISRLLDDGSVNFSATLQAVRDQRAFAIGAPNQWVGAIRAFIQFAINHGLVSTDYDLSELQVDPATDTYYQNNVLMTAAMAAYENAMSHVA